MMYLRKMLVLMGCVALISGTYVVGTPTVRAENTTSVNSSTYANYNVEQLLKLIEELKQRLKELQSQKKCEISNLDLSLGDGDTEATKADVKRLQEFLRKKGFFSANSTGFFGKITRNALMAYQANIGVPQTGVFDAATRDKMVSVGCSVVTPSNTSTTTTSTTSTNRVSSITLSVTGTAATWTVNGNSPSGFKLVFSRNPNPEYPSRNGDGYEFYSDAATRSGTVRTVDGQAGTYYVRVCEYLGGTCGVYSNQVTTQLN